MMKTLATLALLFALALGLQACEEKETERPVPLEVLETARHQLLYRNLARHSMRESVRSKMALLPRHDLLGDDSLARVYLDVPLQPEGGPWLWPPSQLALVLTLFDPQPGRRALLMGAQEGWAAMILASMGVEVHIWDPSSEWAEHVRERLASVKAEDFNPENIQWFETAGEAIAAGPWDYIFVTGTVQEVPPGWITSLRNGSGKLIVPYGTPPAVTLASFTPMDERVVEEEIQRGNFPYLFENPTLNYASLYPKPEPEAPAAAPEGEAATETPEEAASAVEPDAGAATEATPAEEGAADVMSEDEQTQAAMEAGTPLDPAQEAAQMQAQPKSQTPAPVQAENAEEGNAQ